MLNKMSILLFAVVVLMLSLANTALATSGPCLDPCQTRTGPSNSCVPDSSTDGDKCSDCYSCSNGDCVFDQSRDTGGDVDGDCGYCKSCMIGFNMCWPDEWHCMFDLCKSCDNSTGACTVTDDSQDTTGDAVAAETSDVCGLCKKCSGGTCVNDNGSIGSPFKCADCKRCSSGSCDSNDSLGNAASDCGSGCQICNGGSCQDDNTACTNGCDACNNDRCDTPDHSQCTSSPDLKCKHVEAAPGPPAVSEDFLCVECLESTDCTFDANKPYCDKDTNTCAGVVIESADITEGTDGKIVISLGGAASSTLTLELLGNDDTVTTDDHTIRSVTKSSGADQEETFDIDNLATGEYKKVKITWNGETDEYDYHIYVLGDYKHTCYNTPDESEGDCEGTNSHFSWVAGTCAVTSCSGWTDVVCEDPWLTEVAENGSGKSVGDGIVSREWVCTGNTYDRMRKTGTPCSSSGKPITVSDVAIKSSHAVLSLGDTVFVKGNGTFDVLDYGGVLVEAQLDHYSGVTPCNDCTPLGDSIMTVKIYD